MIRKITKTYEMTIEVEFEIDDSVNTTQWSDDGQLHPRMEGIYPEIVTEDELLQHLAWNTLVNDVKDASNLDGFADIEPGRWTFDIPRRSIVIEGER